MQDAKKFTKIYNARAQPSFCSFNLLFIDVLLPLPSWFSLTPYWIFNAAVSFVGGKEDQQIIVIGNEVVGEHFEHLMFSTTDIVCVPCSVLRACNTFDILLACPMKKLAQSIQQLNEL